MLLEIDGLKTYYRNRGTEVRAVDDVSLTVGFKENMGLVGESGCGKTTLSKTLMRIIPPTARIAGGNIRLEGRNIVTMSDAELDRVRWREISMVTQSAMNSLDPVYTAGEQIIETLRVHQKVTREKAWQRAEELFQMVKLDPDRLKEYPHQLSGGMRQRVVIALALALDPKLIIADEPTTALDVVVQDGIIKQLEEIQKRCGNSIILVTHDVSLVAEMCHRVAVMYAGRLMEVGTTDQVFNHPLHPYTMGLLNAYPTLESARGQLVSIPGAPPNLSERIPGCPFAERCPFTIDKCLEERPLEVEVETGHLSACHYANKAVNFRSAAKDQKTWEQSEAALTIRGAKKITQGIDIAEKNGDVPSTQKIIPQNSAPATAASKSSKTDVFVDPKVKSILKVENMERWFPLSSGLMDWILRRPMRYVHAVDGVSFEIGRGEIVGLAGESGSGKSTLGEVITGGQQNTGGTLLFEGRPVFEKGRIRPTLRRRIQMAFQDPYETLNPRFTVYNTVVEPLNNFEIGEKKERRDKVLEALTRVDLNPPEYFFDRYPHELSGGQRQRVAIARAIVVEPHLLLADEPVSMLDVSIRAGVLNLFRRFRDELGMSIVYVSHDLATIRYICDRTAILYLGRFAEFGPTEEVIEHPKHPYTQLLLSAVPRSNPQAARAHVDARGEIPSAIDVPNGCRFHDRCPEALVRCGWEGRDLQALVKEAVNSESTEGRLLKKRGKALKTEGLDFVIKLNKSNKHNLETKDLISAATKDLQAAVESIMAKTDSTIKDAVVSVTENSEELRFSFAHQDNPPFFSAGENHTASCHLLNGDSST